jgi:hypothetical protein
MTTEGRLERILILPAGRGCTARAARNLCLIQGSTPHPVLDLRRVSGRPDGVDGSPRARFPRQPFRAGAERLRDELRKLGILVCKRTVQRYKRETPRRRAKLGDLLRDHVAWAGDFVQIYDVRFQRLCALFSRAPLRRLRVPELAEAAYSAALQNDWVLRPIVEFSSTDTLREMIPARIVAPAENRRKKREELLKELFHETPSA